MVVEGEAGGVVVGTARAGMGIRKDSSPLLHVKYLLVPRCCGS